MAAAKLVSLPTSTIKNLIKASDTLHTLYKSGQINMSGKTMLQMLKSAESATSEMVKQQKRRGAPASIVPDEERQQVLSQERANPFANNLVQERN